jgi:hypothetical protein
METESTFDYTYSPSDIFQSELGTAALTLARRRLGLKWNDPVEPAVFFDTATEICKEFYEYFAPSHTLDDLLPSEIMECVTFAVHHLTYGRPTLTL